MLLTERILSQNYTRASESPGDNSHNREDLCSTNSDPQSNSSWQKNSLRAQTSPGIQRVLKLTSPPAAGEERERATLGTAWERKARTAALLSMRCMFPTYRFAVIPLQSQLERTQIRNFREFGTAGREKASDNSPQ